MTQTHALARALTVPGIDLDLGLVLDVDIAGVPWPSEAHRRTELARAGVPRLLFIEPGHAPPPLWDLDEDWVRVPTSADEVMLRVATLRRRLATRAHPSRRHLER
ncbi:MAG TPA: hypothetical protein VIT24_11160 [Acidimicrobiales bacterium]|jgi:hypothetical protein